MINVKILNGVAWVEMNAPPVNILDKALLAELNDELTELGTDESLSAVLLSGAGKCFSAGASVAEHRQEYAAEMIKGLADVCRTLYDLPMVTVALVHGPCMGGGMELPLFCDFVVADPGAQFGVPEITLAFFPPFACYQLPKLTGRQNAAFLALTGEAITANTAQTMGLVQKIVPKDEWESVGKKLSRLSRPVLRLTKEALRKGLSEGLDAQIDLFLNRLYQTEDVNEGISSFMEKRRPEWKHK